MDPGPVDGVINGPGEARKAVRPRYKDGADLINLTAMGGVLSFAASGQNPQFTNAELQAIFRDCLGLRRDCRRACSRCRGHEASGAGRGGFD